MPDAEITEANCAAVRPVPVLLNVSVWPAGTVRVLAVGVIEVPVYVPLIGAVDVTAGEPALPIVADVPPPLVIFWTFSPPTELVRTATGVAAVPTTRLFDALLVVAAALKLLP